MLTSENSAGLTVAKYTTCLANGETIAERTAFARRHYPAAEPAFSQVFKATVAAGTTTDTTWAEPFATSGLASDLIAALRPATVVDRLVGVGARAVPIRTDVPREVTGTGGAWVSEGQPIPIDKSAFDTTSVGSYKTGVIVVMTRELMRSAKPAHLRTHRDSVVAGVTHFLDEQFLSPAVAEVPNTTPASITNGATEIASTGSTLSAITLDVGSLFAAMADDIERPVFIMKRKTAVHINRMMTLGGVTPTILQNGGTLFGVPVIVTSAQATDIGSPTSTDSYITLVDAASILIGDEGRAAVDVADDASLVMNDAPSAGAQQVVSMFQTNSAAVRVVREIAWKRARPGAVAFMRVAY